MAELIGRRPVASLRKRNVYKTEFDIFKQNTDIDLISLISYDDERTQKESKVTYRDCKDSVSKKDQKSNNSSFNSNYKDSSRSIRNILRTSLIERQNRENPRIKGIRHSERACKSAVYLKGNNSRARDVTQRSQTAFGSRISERNRNNYNSQSSSASKNVNVPKTPSVCSRYRTSHSARRTATNPKDGDKDVVRSRSAYGYSNCRSLSHDKSKPSKTKDCEVSGTLGSNEGQDRHLSRPKTVAGLRPTSEEKLGDGNAYHVSALERSGAVNLKLECGESKRHSDRTIKAFAEDKDNWESPIEAQSEARTLRSTQDSDSCDSVKYDDDGLNSKDSGYQSRICTPDLIKAQPLQEKEICVNDDTGLSNSGLENNSVKKHVTFNVDDSCGSDISNVSEIDEVSLTADDVVSDLESEPELSNSKTAQDVYDFNCLFTDLEQTNIGRQGGDKIYSESICASENNSIFDESLLKFDREKGEENPVSDQIIEEVDEGSTSENCELNTNTTMSREARFAIIETLHDMKGKRSASKSYSINNKENTSASTLHRSVGYHKRIRQNRSKYDQYMRERTNTFIGHNQSSNDKARHNGSVYSEDDESRDCDESNNSSAENIKQSNVLPAIGNGPGQNRDITKTRIYSLEQAKRKKYKIPGIGNYDLVMSPEAEFEITPPGFDSRYDARPIISKEEMELPPKFIHDRSITKCKKWLRNVNLSPLSLNPVLKRRESNS